MIRIGTSGWSYEHWKGPFYPEDLPTKNMLEFYFTKFDTVEINNSFYVLPLEKTFESWKDRAPSDFIYSVKASRYITHRKKLNEPERTLPNFFARVKGLSEKEGPILFQLPPRFHVNVERLEAFLKALPKGHRYTFEFRDSTWFEEKVYELLARINSAFCIYEFSGLLSPRKITADFVYVRLHGPDGPYQGQYKDETLESWAEFAIEWEEKGKDVFFYFDNDQAGYAAQDALRLKSMVGERSYART